MRCGQLTPNQNQKGHGSRDIKKQTSLVLATLGRFRNAILKGHCHCSVVWALRANPLRSDIRSGSFLTTFFHRVENFLKIKSLVLCSLIKLISAFIHNKAFILLFG
jgi:hypothetical protein